MASLLEMKKELKEDARRMLNKIRAEIQGPRQHKKLKNDKKIFLEYFLGKVKRCLKDVSNISFHLAKKTY